VKRIDLKVLRVRSGVRQYELAAQLGMNLSGLRMAENGRVPLTPDLAARTWVAPGSEAKAPRLGGGRGEKQKR
jgi:transcriptional regulator with XRE-family HTH domain